MKGEIRTVSRELLLRHGYQGFRFRDVAEMLQTTRANIHHHYGNKLNLCEEVVVEYVEQTLQDWEANWLGPRSFADKIRGMMESNRARYLRYNPTATTANPWSLIGRMRLERDLIGPRAREALSDFGRKLDAMIVAGIEQAVANGELSDDIPRGDIALQLAATADSAGSITQDGGNFDRLEQLYLSLSRIVHHAYGTARGEA